ncbi:MAG TPA: ATP-binding protein [Planctomycetota bacterium]|jgi:hypothetical protein
MAEPSETGNRLRPRARLLRTLGEELISSEVVAVLELVKNAYDADATRVKVRFVGPLELGEGYIEVIDNGVGMKLETARTVWMEPATKSKRGELRRSPKFKRRYLGEKGIGRFASSRLANVLEVISRCENTAKEVYAIFDWRQFENEDKYLDEILILWEERDPIDIKPDGLIQLLWKDAKRKPLLNRLKNGTILRMSGLKQKWNSKQFEELRRGLARLVSPVAADSDIETFEIDLDLPPEFAEFSSKVEPPPILNHPHYTVSGTVSEDGSFEFIYRIFAEGTESRFHGRFVRLKDKSGRLKFRALDLESTKEENWPQDFKTMVCGPLKIELKVWDRDELGNVVQMTRSTTSDVRRDLDSIAGINIYRDNFRVLPYGEPRDDWLRLDMRRVQNPTMRLSNNQIYGIVQISADNNPRLRDQSNREGLDENEALDDLRCVVTEVLGHLEPMRWTARPRASAKTGRPVGGLFAGFDFSPVAEFLERKLPADTEAKALLGKTEASFGSQLKEIQTVLARYQRLATLGQLIDHVLHEGRQPIASIKNETELGLADVAKTPVPCREVADKFGKRLTIVQNNGNVLATAFARMEPFGGRKRGRPAQFYLEQLIKDAFEMFRDVITQLDVRTMLPDTQTLVRVDYAEMQEIIVNLLQNSLYWLEQTNEVKRAIAVNVERKGPDHVDITFSDSGPGIPSENRSLIFEPYFSTKPDGVGLGLSIAGEIATDYYGGALELLDTGPLKGATFLVTLRKRV